MTEPSPSPAVKPPPGGYRGHIAELDAIRSIGITIVLINHFWPHSLSRLIYAVGQFGWIPMDAFFVLSGFLITGILLDTKTRSDYFRNYYVRRSLRIFPLYFAVLIAIVLVTRHTAAAGGSEYSLMERHWGSPAWFFVYLGNFKSAYMGAFPPVFAYGPLWSLQIEEQFYLLFPLAVRWMRVDHLARMLWCMVFLSPVFRFLFYLKDPHNTLAPFVLLPCHMEGLALGGLIAIRFRTGPWTLPKLRLTLLTAGLLLLTVAGAILTSPAHGVVDWSTPFNRLAGFSLSSFACAGLVLWLIAFRGSSYTRLLRLAPLKYIATISYGVYLLHPLASILLRSVTASLGIPLGPESFLRFVAVVAASIGLASLSWFAFEKPLIGVKDRIAPRHAPESALVKA